MQVDEGKIQELALKELKLYIDLNSLLDEEERCVDLSDVEGLMDVLRRKQRLISEQEMLQGLWAEVASAMGI
ncbi:MAG TPA: flagellar biosynthesis protein FlgN, partial [Thermosynergistes sp.]|nr:flagellar biosynthesis protein FlgN [Thermosynergistes sp.]